MNDEQVEATSDSAGLPWTNADPNCTLAPSEVKVIWDVGQCTRVIVVCCVTLLIISSNILNILGWLKVMHIATATRIFLINLSVSDLLVGLLASSLSIYPVAVRHWPFGPALCQVSGIIHGSSLTVSIWSISLVSIDRFLAVTWPIKYAAMVTKRKCAVIVTVMWILAIVSFLAPCLTMDDFIYYKYEDSYGMCGLYWYYRVFCTIASFCIPILSGAILLFTSINIARALKLSNQFQRANIGVVRRNSASMNDRALKVVIRTSVVYFSFWGPYVTLVVSKSLAPSLNDLVPDWLSFSALWLANSNSGVNVFVYSMANHSFRHQLLKMVCRKSVHSGPNCDNSSS